MEQISFMTNEKIVSKLKTKMDEDLLEELIQRFKPMVKKYSRIYYLYQFDFEDLQQEANIILLKAINTYDPTKTPYFAPYYHSMYRHRLYNLLRYSNATCREIQNCLTHLEDTSKNTNLCLAETLKDGHILTPDEIIEIKNKSSQYLSTLSKFEKQILIKYLENENYQKIADELNISVRKLNDAIYRCHKKLKK